MSSDSESGSSSSGAGEKKHTHKGSKKGKMGKNKYGGGGYGGGALNAFIAFKERAEANAPLFPDTDAASDLLKTIGEDKKWTAEQMEADIAILTKNRLQTIADLRSLSDESWKSLEFLPLVKDLLREAIGKKKGAAPAEGAETSAGDAVGEIANGVSNVSLQSAPPPGRIRVRADDGKTYEVDQFCPHKGADLSRANIVNGLLVCPKHQWRFDLKSGGSCHKGASINAVCVANDW
eukprot:Opistho-2@49547